MIDSRIEDPSRDPGRRETLDDAIRSLSSAAVGIREGIGAYLGATADELRARMTNVLLAVFIRVAGMLVLIASVLVGTVLLLTGLAFGIAAWLQIPGWAGSILVGVGVIVSAVLFATFWVGWYKSARLAALRARYEEPNVTEPA